MRAYVGKISLILLVILLLSATQCLAGDIALVSIPGLTLDIYYSLSGVWNVARPGGEFPTDKKEVFSWGVGRYETYFSVLIDLGVEHPYIKQGFNWFEVVSVERQSSTSYKVDCRVIRAEVKSGFIFLHLKKGVLTLEGHFLPTGIAVFSVQTTIGLQRMSGPQYFDSSQK
ncbi:MAG: hypothetical protein A2Y63_00725 [Candidatus Riflebacteria bacterium RBG_13_59_9]|nr:MAG: hypothetical protein A2Y63_00725 [Candidatus Riflebacteria bacterium RBG_13_59_9]